MDKQTLLNQVKELNMGPKFAVSQKQIRVIQGLDTKEILEKVIETKLDPEFGSLIKNLNSQLQEHWASMSLARKGAPQFKELAPNNRGHRGVVSFNSALEGEMSAIVETVTDEVLKTTNYEIKKSHQQGGTKNAGRAEDSLWLQRKLSAEELEEIKSAYPEREANWFELHKIAQEISAPGLVGMMRDDENLKVLVYQPLSKAGFLDTEMEKFRRDLEEEHELQNCIGPVRDVTSEVREHWGIFNPELKETQEMLDDECYDLAGFIIDFNELEPYCQKWEVMFSTGASSYVFAPRCSADDKDDELIARGVWFRHSMLIDVPKERAIIDRGSAGRHKIEVEYDQEPEYKPTVQSQMDLFG